MNTSSEAMIRQSLLDNGASPETADRLTADFLFRANRACEQDRRIARAAELLPLGHAVAAERAGCHTSTVYRRAKKFAQLRKRANESS